MLKSLVNTRQAPVLCAVVLGLASACIGDSVAAAEMKSVYQDMPIKGCRDTNPTPEARRGDHETVGYDCGKVSGYGVFYTELPNAKEFRIDPPGGKSPGPQLRFSSGLGARIEWRGVASPKGFQPKAVIIRTGSTAHGPRPVSVLNILKVEPKQICLAAVLDVSANKDANAMARVAADGLDGFMCGTSGVMILGVETATARDARDQTY